MIGIISTLILEKFINVCIMFVLWLVSFVIMVIMDGQIWKAQ